MDILVTNDDGIDSPGLWALVEAMSRVGSTLVVAPADQQSGVGTAFSLHSGISIDEVPSPISGVEAYAVGGTPSDCVMLGIRRLSGDRRISLLVSGINLGGNMGRDIPYSGTVMATLQGYFRKIPSVAISLAIRDRTKEPGYDVAARVAEHLALRIENGTMPTDAILNTNVPDIPLDQIRGIVSTRTAPGAYVRLAPVPDQGGVSYTRDTAAAHDAYPEGTDIWAIDAGMISITPIRIEMTDHDRIPVLVEHVSALQSDLLGRGDRG